MATCTGTTKAGKPCGMRPAAGQTLCVNHGGAKAEREKREHVKTGGRGDGPGKGPGSSQERDAAPPWGIVGGVVVGALLAAAMVYAGIRLAGAPAAEAQGNNVQPLRRPG